MLRMPLFLFCALLFGQVWASEAVQSKAVYGYLERAVLVDKPLMLKAKLDTGANSASLYAKRIRHIDIKGKPFVRFVVPTKTGDIPFTVPYLGEVSIKARSGEVGGVRIKNPFIKRPVVSMRVQLGHEVRMIRVNLANRKRFAYPLLLGREALIAFHAVVDPGQKFTLNTTVAVH